MLDTYCMIRKIISLGKYFRVVALPKVEKPTPGIDEVDPAKQGKNLGILELKILVR